MTSKVKRITKFNRCIQFVISGHPTVATRVNKHFVSAGTQSDTLAEMEGHTGLDIRLVDAVARGASRFENLLAPQKTNWPLPQNQTCAMKKIFA